MPSCEPHCAFVPSGPNQYACKHCGATHACGADVCTSAAYNRHQTWVCSLTGACLGQRICDIVHNDGRSMVLEPDPSYQVRTKRTQQARNSQLKLSDVVGIIRAIPTEPVLGVEQVHCLTTQICSLWEDFVAESQAKKRDIPRKDRRCFVVAIVFSLHNGLCSYSSKTYLVQPHPRIQALDVNKKKAYKLFSVSDITEGQKTIKEVFADSAEVRTPINIEV